MQEFDVADQSPRGRMGKYGDVSHRRNLNNYSELSSADLPTFSRPWVSAKSTTSLRLPSTSQRAQAFTLLELLVTVAIVSILAAILLTGSHTIRETSNSAKCVSNQRQIITAMLLYAGENGGRLPPYVDSYDSINLYANTPEGKRIGVEYLNCPTAHGSYSFGMNYGPASQGVGVFFYENQNSPGSLLVSQVPPKMILLGDAIQNVIYNPENWGLHGSTDNVALRHNGGFNCGFVDGSVRRVTKDEWYTDHSPLWSRRQYR